MKKVLIITYYWPPSGGSPVLRWLNFAKYLPEHGWQPIIFTPKNPVPQAIDEDLLNEVPEHVQVFKGIVREPANFLGIKKSAKIQPAGLINEKKKKSLVQELVIWIRGNFFIPDARLFWIRPAARHIVKIIKDNPVDAIISTGPPHSTHMIAYRVKRRLGIPWLADFRDPWTKIDYYQDLKLGKLADRIHHKLEKKVLLYSDTVVTVGPTMTEEFTEMGCEHVHTITNGHDTNPEIFKGLTQSDKFSILHIGSMPSSRNPKNLWPVLNQLCSGNQDFASKLEIKLIGKVDSSIMQAIKENKLEPYLVRIDNIPNKEALREMFKASILLLIVNNTHNSKGILTNKFFEYLSVGRPILCIGPEDGDVAEIMKDTEAGDVVDYAEVEILEEKVSKYYKQFLNSDFKNTTKNTNRYSRKGLTIELVNLLENIIKD